ncbi:hypothetical protein J2S74_002901 [Evansella vedderi]|uniref:Uncharacterized protein n=1 Tax=Evansella vedderi TaxID=38282 RepID=A0ABT9ZXC4_9BACI|nr:Rad52/Rad22 family DNA repair protein [Evansella vedderi]MDQ0255519.1 hypothetical protein [Evansella vedderi]
MCIAKDLNNPFEYENYGVNYEGIVYVGQQAVADRLNDVIGPFNWELEIVEQNIDMQNYSVSVLGRLKAYDPETDRWISRTQFGNDTMTILKNNSAPLPQAIEDAKKSAISDALKKCASWYGCASDVFRGKVTAIKRETKNGDENKAYRALVNNFGLDTYSPLFKNGIVILPDSYREYYVSKGWQGIFQSDLDNAFKSGNTGQQNHQNQNRGQQQGNGQQRQSQSSGNQPNDFRIKSKYQAKENNDGTAFFKAIMEDRSEVNVIVPKEMAQKAVSMVGRDFVLNVTGWHNKDKGFIRLAKNSDIQIEPQSQAS